MAIVYVVVSIMGAIITFLLAAQYSVGLALLAAPFGGSLLALGTAFYLVWQSDTDEARRCLAHPSTAECSNDLHQRAH